MLVIVSEAVDQNARAKARHMFWACLAGEPAQNMLGSAREAEWEADAPKTDQVGSKMTHEVPKSAGEDDYGLQDGSEFASPIPLGRGEPIAIQWGEGRWTVNSKHIYTYT